MPSVLTVCWSKSQLFIFINRASFKTFYEKHKTHQPKARLQEIIKIHQKKEDMEKIENSHIFFLFYTYRDKFNMDRMEERGVEEIITNL